MKKLKPYFAFILKYIFKLNVCECTTVILKKTYGIESVFNKSYEKLFARLREFFLYKYLYLFHHPPSRFRQGETNKLCRQSYNGKIIQFLTEIG